jgi:hypothetical protein
MIGAVAAIIVIPTAVSTQGRHKAAPMAALTAIDKLLFWLGIGAAQKGARSKEVKPNRNWVVSLVAGSLLAAVMIVGMFLLLVSHKL